MSAMVKVDKNIPVPNNAGIAGRKSIYPWAIMEVGDSFVIVCPNPTTRSGQIGKANRDYQPKRFTQQKNPGGMRVWRIA